MSLDIVIVNYRTPDYLRRCLLSLVQHPPAFCSYKVWVVNVDPENDDLVAGHEASGWANHIVLDDNVGYARACNRVASLGDHDVIGLFNADVEFLPETLDRCHSALRTNPTWGVLGPLQYDRQKRTTHAGIFGTSNKPHHRAWHRRVTDQYRDVVPAVTVAGSAYFIKRDVWDRLTRCGRYREVAPDAEGAFLPTPHYYEETFCSYHARAHGYDVVYFGHAEMIHDWKRSPGPVDAYFKESREIFRAACDAHAIPHD